MTLSLGFGFNLLFAFVIVPICIILLILGVVSRKKIFVIIIGYIFTGIIALIVLSSIIQGFTATIELEKEDYYGTYIVDRSKFPGKQSDWQYDNFRFEIKSNDSIFFYSTRGEKITHTFKGKVSTVKPHVSARLVLNMDQPTHHIIQDNPTTYRDWRDFYLVFNSKRFKNVFFKKGEWKPLEK